MDLQGQLLDIKRAHVISRLDKLILFTAILLFACSKKEFPERYIDGRDLIPPEPPFWEYFTIAGIDSDADGVRDDVELWINSEFDDPNVRKALKWRVSARYRFLYVTNVNQALQLMDEERAAGDCLLGVYGYRLSRNDYSYMDKINQYRSKLNNNWWRNWQLSKASKYVPNGSYSAGSGNVLHELRSCNFEVQNKKWILQQYFKNGQYKNNATEEERADYVRYMEGLK